MRRLIILLAACGGGGSDSPQDAPKPPIDAPPSANCLVPATYGDAGTKTGTTTLGPTTATIVLDATPPRDSFFLKLVAGKGVFTGGLANGTYTIAGADLMQGNCGLCVNILADIGNTGPSKFFFATSGTVTLTATSPPAGSLTNVMLRETDANGVPQGTCMTAISAMQFSAQ
jgi:hypothetical protein